MPTVVQLSPRLVSEFKSVRLRALQDTPTAFGSTYAKESRLSDCEWLERVATWSGSGSVCYLAMEEGAACGIIACYLDKNNAARAYVVSMWVAPSHRRTGLGSTLMNTVERWAEKIGADELRLMVTSRNAAALRFYERCGFALTGVTGPYPNDPAIYEREMAKGLRRV